MSRTLRPRAQLAMGTGVVFCLGLLGSAQHRVTELHGYCSEHGELVHLSVGQAREAADPSAGPAVRRDLWVQGEHDCAVLSFLAQIVVVARSPLLSGAQVCRARASTPLAAVPHAQIPLILQAPKVSPPAAARG